ncbi:MAG TPA: SDR family NAD(P)-dependent oxidoreductase [Beijerinckiaceae bacterium]|nr:SDR family NAD(P)-dependent oxidoreductase [Beijerinckiaceae bacterium]
MANTYDLKGKRAVVTGGAMGIGYAISERFAQSGARVALWDIDEAAAKAAAAKLGAGCIAVPTDVTDYASVEAAARSTESTLGGIDILVCNAGIAGSNEPLDVYPLDMWRRIMAINLDGVFHCLRAVTPGMKARKYGRIVNIASIAGKEGNPNACAYSASKAGVIALTKSLGKELAGLDIAVNCITPAAARTAIFDQMKPEFIQFMLSKIPRGRFVQVEEIAALASWLASAENSFTTGGVFDISGGRATY